MRISIVLVLGLALVGISSQAAVRVYTRPTLPNTRTLERLGLQKRWHAYVPMAGKRDGIVSVQALRGQLVVQTDSGALVAYDGVTGAMQWLVRLGDPFRGLRQDPAYNDWTIYVSVGTKMYAIDRKTGNQDWVTDLPGALAHPPIADVDRLIINTEGTRMHGYMLPLPQSMLKGTAEEPAPPAPRQDGVVLPPPPVGVEGLGARPGSVYMPTPSRTPINVREPIMLWSGAAEALLLYPPLMTETHFVYASLNDTLYSQQKDRRALGQRYSPLKVTSPLGQADEMIYFGVNDLSVYAVEVSSGAFVLRWRFTSGSLTERKPIPVEDDLYVAPNGRGLYCLNRNTGKARWHAPEAAEFITAGKRLVYAADRSGQTLIYDRQRGRLLGTLDTQEYAFRVPNNTTGQLFLANHDGLVVCLQDREEMPIELIDVQVLPRQGGGHDAIVSLRTPLPIRESLPLALRLVFMRENGGLPVGKVSEFQPARGFQPYALDRWRGAGGAILQAEQDIGFVWDLVPRVDWPKLSTMRLRIPLDATTLPKELNATGKGRLYVGLVTDSPKVRELWSNTVTAQVDFDLRLPDPNAKPPMNP